MELERTVAALYQSVDKDEFILITGLKVELKLYKLICSMLGRYFRYTQLITSSNRSFL